MGKTKRLFKRFDIQYINMSHWGDLYLLPSLKLVVNYSQPTFVFTWWIFRFDFIIYRYFPNWFMKYVWNTINLDFSWLKKRKNEKE
jgi:hypothetical protein